MPSAIALLLAILLLSQWRRLPAAFFRAPRLLILGCLSLSAAGLSAGYIAYYLRGGPRIIDATSYWLQARALAEGYVTWPIHEPTASLRGRFLLTSGPLAALRMGVIFPPGYAIILALGFLLQHPLWVGPFIGAFLVLATHSLALSVTGREDVARLAAGLSVFCAALRYHTADTMSHGWAALLFATTLAFSYRGTDAVDRRRQVAYAILAGGSFGWLFTTRPLSALALLPVLLWSTFEMSRRSQLALVIAALLPLSFFFFEQRELTGAFFRSSQAAYYALADGPPGCFRYGFGEGIGCVHEHGLYVASVLPRGLTWAASAITTLRRLRLHLIDIANAEPLVLLVAAAPVLALRRAKIGPLAGTVAARRVIGLCTAVTLVVLAYVPFYFDGSYPGAGARFFADVLPLEHVLLATSLAWLTAGVASNQARRWPLDMERASAVVVAVALTGFGLHAVFEHIRLRDREGGRPFFEPPLLDRAHVDRGLLFTGTDHAFNLAYDPRAHDAQSELVVARAYGDDRDRLMWESLGRPAAYRYVFDGRANIEPSVEPWHPPPLGPAYRYEAEAEWPPLEQSGGFFEPVFASGTCASGERLLAIRRVPGQPFRGTLSFPVPSRGNWQMGVGLASRGDVFAQVMARQDPNEAPQATWTLRSNESSMSCTTLPKKTINLSTYGLLEVSAEGAGELWIDAVFVEADEPGAEKSDAP